MDAFKVIVGILVWFCIGVAIGVLWSVAKYRIRRDRSPYSLCRCGHVRWTHYGVTNGERCCAHTDCTCERFEYLHV